MALTGAAGRTDWEKWLAAGFLAAQNPGFGTRNGPLVQNRAQCTAPPLGGKSTAPVLLFSQPDGRAQPAGHAASLSLLSPGSMILRGSSRPNHMNTSRAW